MCRAACPNGNIETKFCDNKPIKQYYMKKALLFLALFAGSLLSANADDHLTAFVKPGATKQLAVQLNNVTDYTAFQLKINLPEGMSFPEGAEAVLANTAHSTHQIASKVDGQSMIVVVYSYDATEGGNKAFQDNKGSALLLVDVNVTGTFKEASCDVSGVTITGVKDGEQIEFVKTDLTSSAFADVNSAGKLGDVNGDGSLTTKDATSVLKKLVGTIEAGYVENAEDVNSDGSLNTKDVSEILKELVR